jgi:hypothetical protein
MFRTKKPLFLLLGAFALTGQFLTSPCPSRHSRLPKNLTFIKTHKREEQSGSGGVCPLIQVIWFRGGLSVNACHRAYDFAFLMSYLSLVNSILRNKLTQALLAFGLVPIPRESVERYEILPNILPKKTRKNCQNLRNIFECHSEKNEVCV